ncbi:complement decay-accelerating factor isoform X3 [Genypterus blacodes]|uniref:complement decay-accelerating factor isoform X3 n=1 Tax=Genypterus blacodes TaxID=154954 RepID=UPI003F775676
MGHLLDTFTGRMSRSVLIICLFIQTAAAACPPPQGTNTVVLTDKALMINDFPDGIEVTFECGHGYVIEDGSGTVTCLDGTWTQADLRCKKRDCGPPRAQAHMSHEIRASEGTLFGATVKAICDKGYDLTGTAYQSCFATGWSGRPKCKVVTCDKPDEVTNGRTSWDSDAFPEYRAVIKYFCDEGFTLSGNDILVCNEHGEYSSQPPACAEASTTTDSSGTATTHRNKTIPTGSTPADSPSTRGGRDVVTAEDKITTTGKTATASPPGRGRERFCDISVHKEIRYNDNNTLRGRHFSDFMFCSSRTGSMACPSEDTHSVTLRNAPNCQQCVTEPLVPICICVLTQAPLVNKVSFNPSVTDRQTDKP